MAFGIFLHRTDSIYDDVPSERYQFPKQYLSRAQQCEGDWIVYLEPTKVKNTKGYFAVAKVREIIPDPRHQDMYLAVIEPGTYFELGDEVQFRDQGSVVEQGLLNEQGNISGRAIRDRNFRKTVLRAYGERCAITGLRLINGGGRAEVEAAHIRPVEHDGPDIISNGIALSGTAHWMFDRGLVGLSEDLTILVSRQANDPDAVRSMINGTEKLIAPERPSERPRAEFVKWHRENCFKQ
ncbi:MAG: HNH endonuclease [Alphaproteobacteria bacterium]